MRSFFCLVMFLVMCTISFSQQTPEKSKYALSFGIAENFRLDNFNMDIAVKRVFDETHQLRLFLSPRIITNNNEQSVIGTNQSSDIDWSTVNLGVGADYLWTLLSADDISMFSGTGLIISFGSEDNTSSATIENIITKDERTIRQTSAGIRGTLGVEWKVTESIGIHSEYLLTGSYRWSKEERKTFMGDVEASASTGKSTGFFLISSVLFGVSIYL